MDIVPWNVALEPLKAQIRFEDCTLPEFMVHDRANAQLMMKHQMDLIPKYY